MRKTATQSSYHPLVWLLIGSNAIGRASLFMCLIYLTIHMARSGLTGFEVGQIIGAGWLLGSVGGYVGGYLSDRWGRFRILSGSLFFWSFTFIGFAWAESYFTFLVLNMLNGVCRSFYDAVSKTLLTDVVPAEHQEKALLWNYLTLTLAMGGGAFLGASLTGYPSELIFHSIGWTVGGLYIVIFLLGYHYRDSVPKQSNPLTLTSVGRVVRRDRALWVYLLMATCFSIGYSQLETTLPLYLESLSLIIYPIVLATNAALAILFMFLVMNKKVFHWISSLSFERVTVTSSLLFATGLVMFGGSEAPMFFVGIILLTVTEALFFPTWEAEIARRGERQEMKGAYLGSTELIQVGFFIGPVIGGWLLDHYGGTALFSVMAFVGLSVIGIYYTGELFRQKNAHLWQKPPLKWSGRAIRLFLRP